MTHHCRIIALSCLVAVAVIPQLATGQIIQHYQFDGNATAAVGVNGTTVGGASFAAGVIDQALDLNQVPNTNDQHVTAGSINILAGSNSFSASAWFNLNTADTDQDTNHNIDNIIFAQSSGGGNDNIEMGIAGPNQNIELYLDTNGGGDGTQNFTPAAGSEIQANTWHHLVWTYDNTDTGTETHVYLDGQLVGTSSFWDGTVDNAGGSSDFTVGLARPDRANAWGDFDGQIDDLALYSDALTAAEANALYNLALESELNYDAGQAQQLFDFHDSMGAGGSVTIDGLEWLYVDSGLDGGLGELGNSYYLYSLQLDPSGSGLVVLAPEPATVAIWLMLGLAVGGIVWRTRRK